MIEFKVSSRDTYSNLWSFYKSIIKGLASNNNFKYLMELKIHLWKTQTDFVTSTWDPLVLEPLDITSGWIEKSIQQTIFRLRTKVDPKDQKLLYVYRLLGIRYRINHTLKSFFKDKLIVDEEILLLIDLLILEASFGYLNDQPIKLKIK